jgi:hypothetical protein
MNVAITIDTINVSSPVTVGQMIKAENKEPPNLGFSNHATEFA